MISAECVKKKYIRFMKKNNWKYSDDNRCLSVMRKSICKFVNAHHTIAIYGYGIHTEHLMLDFVAELRDVKIIIDNYFDRSQETGYRIIRENELDQEAVDGVIISVYLEREKVLESIKLNHPCIDILDFYTLFDEMKLGVVGSYYNQGQGSEIYRRIHKNRELIKNFTSKEFEVKTKRDIIGMFCAIKDFMSAEKVAKELSEKYHMEKDEAILSDIKELYNLELKLFESIDPKDIYMLCVDGLRKSDLTEQGMTKLYRELKNRCLFFDSAYSYSTSTYESLIPAYSENTDQRTRYFEKAEIKEGGCRFIEEAKKQNKRIVLNTGTGKFFDDSSIDYRKGVLTITEHMWDFALTASRFDNILYYSQPQCESHFPFYNPNTKEPVFDGTAIMFDYLERYGSGIRTDYEKQHKDAIEYLDCVLSPMFERLSCKFLVFADHGNTIIKKNTRIEDVEKTYFGCHKDWVQIPMVLHNGLQTGSSKELESLLDINDIVISLLRDKAYEDKKNRWIKIGRSEIYNPDFRMVYKKAKADHFLLAFEGFVFEDGYKLIVYSDGTKELYNVECDGVINDDEIKEQLFNQIKSNVTVVE